jgi:hypothetical protein
MWLRKLSVGGLVRPLPPLPDGPAFRRRIANHLPRSPKLTPGWLEAVAEVSDWGDERVAIWIAREYMRQPVKAPIRDLRLIAVWSWFSLHGASCGHRMIEKTWHPAMRLNAAREAAKDWRITVRLHLQLGEVPVADPWLRPGHVGGYDFVPLDSADGIVQEAVTMRNCLRGYGYGLARNRCRLWSIRQGDRPIANLEIARLHDGPLLVAAELRAPHNRPVEDQVWPAVARWLQQQNMLLTDGAQLDLGEGGFDASAWRKLWRPYWLAKRRIPSWLPLGPSRAALTRL